ncbi:unnamed protein product [Mytilus edulis]|uniref:Uncharacterized protein n=1 Tax=Mytilus edulis TaxID=6550 RepID=A0A8S3S858_MYTED|nr:unnamed protein product [Mytilus edulis]
MSLLLWCKEITLVLLIGVSCNANKDCKTITSCEMDCDIRPKYRCNNRGIIEVPSFPEATEEMSYRDVLRVERSSRNDSADGTTDFGTETELKVSHPVSNTCTKNDIDDSVIDSQTQDVYTQNNPIFAVEDTENHRENSPNHSTCSSTISDVFPEEDQSNIQDIEQRSEGIANNTRTRLGSVESLKKIFEKKQESTETDMLVTDFQDKLTL